LRRIYDRYRGRQLDIDSGTRLRSVDTIAIGLDKRESIS
jgi:hypothetical protein